MQNVELAEDGTVPQNPNTWAAAAARMLEELDPATVRWLRPYDAIGGEGPSFELDSKQSSDEGLNNEKKATADNESLFCKSFVLFTNHVCL